MIIDGFKPESVDNTKPGLVVTSQGNDTTSVRVERASDNVRLIKQTSPGGSVDLNFA